MSELKALQAETQDLDLIGSTVLETWTKQYGYDPIGSISSLVTFDRKRFRRALSVSLVTVVLAVWPAHQLFMEKGFAAAALILIPLPMMLFWATHLYSMTDKENKMRRTIAIFHENFEVLKGWYPISLRNLITLTKKEAEGIGTEILSRVARRTLELESDNIPNFIKRDQQKELKAEFNRKYTLLVGFGMASGSWTKYFDAARRIMAVDSAKGNIVAAT